MDPDVFGLQPEAVAYFAARLTREMLPPAWCPKGQSEPG